MTRLHTVRALRPAIAGVAVATLVFAAADPALAAEIVGSDLSGTPATSTAVSVGYAQVPYTPRTGSTLPITVTHDGVLTSLRIKHDGSHGHAGAVTFRLLSGTNHTYTARQDARLPDYAFSSTLAAGQAQIVPVDASGKPQGIPIHAGERVAVGQVGPGSLYFMNTAATGAEYDYKSPIPTASSGAVSWNTTSGSGLTYEILVQYTVEPDADGDFYGDETQDACVGQNVPNNGPCPGPAGKTIYGTARKDVIQGTPGDDVIYAGGGNDVIYGNGGNDIIKGGAGNDKIYGGDGNDVLKGGKGTDKCDGGTGTDTAARNCEKKIAVP